VLSSEALQVAVSGPSYRATMGPHNKDSGQPHDISPFLVIDCAVIIQDLHSHSGTYRAWLASRRCQVGIPAHFTDKLMNSITELGGPGYLSRCSNWLRAGRSGDRIPVGARFSAPVQTDPGTHPASDTLGIGPFPGGKRPARGVDHPPSSAEVK
jgi:hypothetical protein